MRIFLIGFMGSGKTSTGQRLAERLGNNFVDLDSFIEERTFLSVSEIIKRFGEDYFRNLEKEYLEELMVYQDMVIACGGGTPCFNNLMEWMKLRGGVIFLNAPVEVLLERLWNDEQLQKRPLIAAYKQPDLKEYIQTLLAQRLPVYEQAQVTVNIKATQRIDEVADLIFNKINVHLNS